MKVEKLTISARKEILRDVVDSLEHSRVTDEITAIINYAVFGMICDRGSGLTEKWGSKPLEMAVTEYIKEYVEEAEYAKQHYNERVKELRASEADTARDFAEQSGERKESLTAAKEDASVRNNYTKESNFMFIYKIEQETNITHKDIYEAIVVAASEEEARDIDPSGSGYVAWDTVSRDNSGWHWCYSRDEVKVTKVGTALATMSRPQVLCASWQEG